MYLNTEISSLKNWTMRIECLKSSPRRCLQLTLSQDHDLHDPQFAADQPWDVDGGHRKASLNRSGFYSIGPQIDTDWYGDIFDWWWFMYANVVRSIVSSPVGRRPAVKMSTAHSDYMPSLTTQKDCSFVYVVCWSPVVPKLDSSGIAPYLLVHSQTIAASCHLWSIKLSKVIKRS